MKTSMMGKKIIMRLGTPEKAKAGVGRPSKPPMQDKDSIRAFIVFLVASKMPDRFRNRLDVINFLQAGREFFLANGSPDDKFLEWESQDIKQVHQIISLFFRFPHGELQQSVSRGMNKNAGFMRMSEEIAEAEGRIYRK